MEKPKLSIYFIHSAEVNANETIYLPVLRSEQLSHDKLIFSASKKYKDKYYKDLIDRANVCVVELTKPDTGLNMELKYAITTKKPILALANKAIGYDAKYDKLLKNIIGYSKVYNGSVDSTVVVGILRDKEETV